MEKEHRRIIGLRTENVLKLGVVEIEPDPNWNGIGGPNDSGKSSLLTAIRAALGGAKFTPAEPVKKGEEKAETVLDLGDILVTWRCTASGSPSLTVDNKKGAIYKSPVAMLEGLIDRFGFDLSDFLRSDSAKQLEVYRIALGLDFAELDQKRAEVYEKRRDVNRDMRGVEARLDQMEAPDDRPEPVDTKGVLAKLEVWKEVEKHGRRELALEYDLAQQKTMLAEVEDRIEKLNKEADEYRSQMFSTEAEIGSEAPEAPASSEQELKDLLSDAQAVTVAIGQFDAAKIVADELDHLAGESGKLTEELRGIDQRKAKEVAGATGAVDGLTFDDYPPALRLNGNPFSQASSRQKFEMALAIGRARNPDMSIVFIEQGAFFDKESRATLRDLAIEKDLQIWFECVDDNESVTILMEDGEVKRATAFAEDKKGPKSRKAKSKKEVAS